MRRVRPLAEVLEGRQLLATITVNSAGDADGVDGGTTLSLRQAIEISNGNLALTAFTPAQQAQVSGALSSPNTIDFNIPGTGPITIKPATILPIVSAPVLIDGYSQPGSSPNTAGPRQADNAVLQIGLDFSAVLSDGADLDLETAGITVQGLAIGGGAGINQPGERIKISVSGLDGDLIQGNFIGTNITGTAALSTRGYGIVSASGANTIGGTTPAARNIISGNQAGGIELDSSNGLIEGNFIGTDVTGTQAIPNATGIHLVGADTNTIGGTAAGAGNLISGNTNDGILLDYTSIDNGGIVPQFFPSDRNTFQGNFIGTDLNGEVSLDNKGYGISIATGNGNTIGGTVAGAGNVIAYSPQAGIGIASVTINQFFGSFDNQQNTISANSIFSNAIGIDLGEDGVTTNISAGSATGPDKLQPYPVFVGSNGISLTASLNAAPSTAYTIEFFASPAGNLGSAGEGLFYRGSMSVTTDSSGLVTFSYTPTAADVSDVISMTATDPQGNTSEFTPQTSLTPPTVTQPVVAVAATASSVVQGQSITLIAAVGSTPTGQPTGLVGFVIDGTVVGFAPLNAQGFATLTVPTGQLAVGAGHSVVAAYQGDSTYQSSLSGKPFSFAVTQPSTIAFVTSATSLEPGQQIKMAAVVSPSSTGLATGVVAFVDNGTQVLGYAPLDASSAATFATDQLPVGYHSITAVYLGDATHPPLISSAITVIGGNTIKNPLAPVVTGTVATGTRSLRVSFSEALLIGPAQNLANYAITGPTGGKITLTSATYDLNGPTVTLTTQQALNPKQNYKLTVKGAKVGGIVSILGLSLKAKNGVGASNVVVSFKG